MGNLKIVGAVLAFGLMLLALISVAREMRDEQRLRCKPGYVLLKHKGEHYCASGYKP